MRAYELLLTNRSLLTAMNECQLSVSDIKYIKLITEYIGMRAEGHKKTYIVGCLSDRYEIPERSLYRIIERLLKDVPLTDDGVA